MLLAQKLRMLPTVFEEKAENLFKSMYLRNKTLNRHRNLYCRKSLSYYVSQSDNRTYNAAPLDTVLKASLSKPELIKIVTLEVANLNFRIRGFGCTAGNTTPDHK